MSGSIKLGGIASFLILFAGCSEVLEQEDILSSASVFYAESPQDETKVMMDCNHNNYWQNSDSISVFRSATNELFIFDGDTGDDEGTFSQKEVNAPNATLSKNYAVYPFKESTSYIQDECFSFTMSGRQIYCENTFDKNSCIWVAETESIDDNILHFKTLTGLLELSIYGGDSIKEISVKGNNDEVLCGLANISFNNEDTLSFESLKEKEVILDCGNGVVTGTTELEAAHFYVVLPPVVFSSGLTVEIRNISDSLFSLRTSGRTEIKSRAITRMKAIKMGNNAGTSFTSFSLCGQDAEYQTIGIKDSNVWVYVPYEEDKSDLLATFTTDGAEVYANNTIQESGVTRNDFTNAVEYIVKAASGEQQKYYVHAFSSEIPVVTINTTKDVVNKVDWIRAKMSIRLPDGDLVFNDSLNIRGRGNASWGYPKKPYALKLDSKTAILGMKKHKRWCLLANYVDRTLLRNEVSLEVGRRAGKLEWTPHGTFVDLVYNGNFVGNYYLCEQIKVDKNRVNIDEENGYLLEMDRYMSERNTFWSEYFNLPYNIKNPEDDKITSGQISDIKSFISSMESELKNPDSLKVHSYTKYLDPYSFADYWLVNEVVTLYEPNNPYSCFVYKDVGEKLKAGPIWDFDYSTFRSSQYYLYEIKNALYYKALFQDDYFKSIVKERWADLSQKLRGANSILDHVDSLYNSISCSAMRNEIIWPMTTSYNLDESYSIDDAVFKMKEYLERRLDWMDTNIPKL